MRKKEEEVVKAKRKDAYREQVKEEIMDRWITIEKEEGQRRRKKEEEEAVKGKRRRRGDAK